MVLFSCVLFTKAVAVNGPVLLCALHKSRGREWSCSPVGVFPDPGPALHHFLNPMGVTPEPASVSPDHTACGCVTAPDLQAHGGTLQAALFGACCKLPCLGCTAGCRHLGHAASCPVKGTLQAAAIRLQVGMLKEMVEFSARTMSTAEEWSSERESQLTEELDAHLRAHR